MTSQILNHSLVNVRILKDNCSICLKFSTSNDIDIIIRYSFFKKNLASEKFNSFETLYNFSHLCSRPLLKERQLMQKVKGLANGLNLNLCKAFNIICFVKNCHMAISQTDYSLAYFSTLQITEMT